MRRRADASRGSLQLLAVGVAGPYPSTLRAGTSRPREALPPCAFAGAGTVGLPQARGACFLFVFILQAPQLPVHMYFTLQEEA